MTTSLLRPHAVAGLGSRNAPLVTKHSVGTKHKSAVASKKISSLKLRHGVRVTVAAASREVEDNRTNIGSRVASCVVANVATAAYTMLVRSHTPPNRPPPTLCFFRYV